MDDVPTGQPALALAQKVIERVTAAGLPADLIPGSITSVSVAPHVDAENSLRSAVLEFMDTVRTTEHAIAAGRRGEDVPEELDVASIGDVARRSGARTGPPRSKPRLNRRRRTPSPRPIAFPSRHLLTCPSPGRSSVPEPGPVDVPEPSPQDGSVGRRNGNGVELQDQEVIVESR